MKIIFVVIILFISIGCSTLSSNKNHCPVIISHYLNPTGVRKSFNLPDNILCYAINIQVSEGDDGIKYLYVMGRENEILKYTLNSNDLIHSIKLAERGPNGIGKANGFYVISKDSVLITSKYVQQLNFVDGNGRKISTVNYRNDSLKTSSTRCDYHTQILFSDGGKIIVPQALEGNWNHLTLSEFESFQSHLLVDTNSEFTQKAGMKIPYPKSELKLKSFNFSAVQAGNNFVLSFEGSDSIFVSKDMMHFEGLQCSSGHLQGKLAQYLGTQDVQKLMIQKAKSGFYTSLVWDPYREVLYRFYKLPEAELKTSDNLFEKNHYPSSFGIMTINQNMEIIADDVFESNKYFFSNHFVTEEGLYLSINHPLNTYMDYTKLTFELLNLESK